MATFAESFTPDITSAAKNMSTAIVTGMIGILMIVPRYSTAVFPEMTQVATYESMVRTPAVAAMFFDVPLSKALYVPPFTGSDSTTSRYTPL